MAQLERNLPGHGGEQAEDENEFDASGEDGLEQPPVEDGGDAGSDTEGNDGAGAGAGPDLSRTAVGYSQHLPPFVRW